MERNGRTRPLSLLFVAFVLFVVVLAIWLVILQLGFQATVVPCLSTRLWQTTTRSWLTKLQLTKPGQLQRVNDIGAHYPSIQRLELRNSSLSTLMLSNRNWTHLEVVIVKNRGILREMHLDVSSLNQIHVTSEKNFWRRKKKDSPRRGDRGPVFSKKTLKAAKEVVPKSWKDFEDLFPDEEVKLDAACSFGAVPRLRQKNEQSCNLLSAGAIAIINKRMDLQEVLNRRRRAKKRGKFKKQVLVAEECLREMVGSARNIPLTNQSRAHVLATGAILNLPSEVFRRGHWFGDVIVVDPKALKAKLCSTGRHSVAVVGHLSASKTGGFWVCKNWTKSWFLIADLSPKDVSDKLRESWNLWIP